MPLIVETGLIVPGADTYASVDDLRAYAAKRGASLPADDTDCEVLLVKAMDYLASKSERWKGQRVQLDQPLDWPRLRCGILNRLQIDRLDIDGELHLTALDVGRDFVEG